MKTSLDCLACFVRQALDASRHVSDDPAFHERMVRETICDLVDRAWAQPAPIVAQGIHRRVREAAGIADPYLAQKQAHNALALRLLPTLRDAVERSEDPLISAAHFAIAGNIIDLGVKGGLDESEVLQAVELAAAKPLEGDVEPFRSAVTAADSILYLADNAGEIVFDRLLIEQLGTDRVTLAVRGGPILNDALRADACAAGLDALVPVIDNGTDLPGTDLTQCSDAFREHFESADIIISKGQGNYETLSEDPHCIFFLFKVKCPMVAKASGRHLGAHVLQ
jgi:uncharacterized protein with ATP-grasp and redox domains